MQEKSTNANFLSVLFIYSNEDNDEADNELTIIQAGNNGNSYSQSYLKAHLVAGESYTLNNFGGNDNSLVIRLISIEESDNRPWKANVVVSTSGTGPVPTKNPTLQVRIIDVLE